MNNRQTKNIIILLLMLPLVYLLASFGYWLYGRHQHQSIVQMIESSGHTVKSNSVAPYVPYSFRLSSQMDVEVGMQDQMLSVLFDDDDSSINPVKDMLSSLLSSDSVRISMNGNKWNIELNDKDNEIQGSITIVLDGSDWVQNLSDASIKGIDGYIKFSPKDEPSSFGVNVHLLGLNTHDLMDYLGSDKNDADVLLAKKARLELITTQPSLGSAAMVFEADKLRLGRPTEKISVQISAELKKNNETTSEFMGMFKEFTDLEWSTQLTDAEFPAKFNIDMTFSDVNVDYLMGSEIDFDRAIGTALVSSSFQMGEKTSMDAHAKIKTVENGKTNMDASIDYQTSPELSRRLGSLWLEFATIAERNGASVHALKPVYDSKTQGAKGSITLKLEGMDNIKEDDIAVDSVVFKAVGKTIDGDTKSSLQFSMSDFNSERNSSGPLNVTLDGIDIGVGLVESLLLNANTAGIQESEALKDDAAQAREDFISALEKTKNTTVHLQYTSDNFSFQSEENPLAMGLLQLDFNLDGNATVLDFHLESDQTNKNLVNGAVVFGPEFLPILSSYSKVNGRELTDANITFLSEDALPSTVKFSLDARKGLLDQLQIKLIDKNVVVELRPCSESQSCYKVARLQVDQYDNWLNLLDVVAHVANNQICPGSDFPRYISSYMKKNIAPRVAEAKAKGEEQFSQEMIGINQCSGEGAFTYIQSEDQKGGNKEGLVGVGSVVRHDLLYNDAVQHSFSYHYRSETYPHFYFDHVIEIDNEGAEFWSDYLTGTVFQPRSALLNFSDLLARRGGNNGVFDEYLDGPIKSKLFSESGYSIKDATKEKAARDEIKAILSKWLIQEKTWSKDPISGDNAEKLEKERGASRTKVLNDIHAVLNKYQAEENKTSLGPILPDLI